MVETTLNRMAEGREVHIFQHSKLAPLFGYQLEAGSFSATGADSNLTLAGTDLQSQSGHGVYSLNLNLAEWSVRLGPDFALFENGVGRDKVVFEVVFLERTGTPGDLEPLTEDRLEEAANKLRQLGEGKQVSNFLWRKGHDTVVTPTEPGLFLVRLERVQGKNVLGIGRADPKYVSGEPTHISRYDPASGQKWDWAIGADSVKLWNGSSWVTLIFFERAK